jgi:hypothetical protein
MDICAFIGGPVVQADSEPIWTAAMLCPGPFETTFLMTHQHPNERLVAQNVTSPTPVLRIRVPRPCDSKGQLGEAADAYGLRDTFAHAMSVSPNIAMCMGYYSPFLLPLPLSKALATRPSAEISISSAGHPG